MIINNLLKLKNMRFVQISRLNVFWETLKYNILYIYCLQLLLFVFSDAKNFTNLMICQQVFFPRLQSEVRNSTSVGLPTLSHNGTFGCTNILPAVALATASGRKEEEEEEKKKKKKKLPLNSALQSQRWRIAAAVSSG